MEARNMSSAVVHSYWNSLSHLHPSAKVELITLLASSLTAYKPSVESNWADRFYGAWKDDKSAEDMIAEIHAARHTGTRQLASFD